MKIDRDGTVTVAESDVETYRDGRLPLHERLARLGTFMRSDAWTREHAGPAAALISEVADRLRSLRAEDEGRVTLFKHMDEENRALKAEIKALREQYTVDVANLQHELYEARRKK